MPQGFTIEQEAFSGPYGLLLELIEKRKLHIGDLDLSQVVDDYTNYVREGKVIVEELADFLLVAATLLLIKSEALLPQSSPIVKENGDIADLKDRLLRYQQIQEQSRKLLSRMGTGYGYSPKDKPQTIETRGFYPDTHLNVILLHTLARTLATKIPTVEQIPQARVVKQISFEEVMARVAKRVTEQLESRFHHIGGNTRSEILLSFLAILELAKLGHIQLLQEEPFRDILITTNQYGTPRYA